MNTRRTQAGGAEEGILKQETRFRTPKGIETGFPSRVPMTASLV